jgi:hypothetical protein
MWASTTVLVVTPMMPISGGETVQTIGSLSWVLT